MPESSDIDAALLAKLGSDATLLALMPNGVHRDFPTEKLTRFVVVSLVEHHDDRTFSGRASESALYLVKAVGLSAPNQPQPNMRDAAARIDALLEGGTLTVAGYELLAMYREERISTAEPDDLDPQVRWYHRGGQYRIVMGL